MLNRLLEFRRVLLRYGGVGQHRGRAALVAQPVDEDLALALGLAHRRDELVGLEQAQRLGEAAREVLVHLPRVPRRQWRDIGRAIRRGIYVSVGGTEYM